MNKDQNTYLSQSQFMFTLVSSIVGVGILYIPTGPVRYAKQDAWIACILGGVYPIYLLFIARFLSRRFPSDNIMSLSKKFLGKFIGNIFNIIFSLFFLFIISSELAGFGYSYYTYVTNFISIPKIFTVCLLTVAYIAYKGIKPLGRLNEVIFYLTVILVVLPSGALLKGSILNIKPVFQANIMDMVLASKETAFFYTGMEVIFLIYPFMEDKTKLFKSGITIILFVMALYVWTVFVTIYYLGPDIVPKYLWPVVGLTDAINIPVINSFRFIFMSLWGLVILKCLATYYFALVYSFNQIFSKISAEKFTVIFFPIIIFASLSYGNSSSRRDYSGKITPVFVLFNIFFITLISVIIKLKRGKADEK